MAKGSQLNKEHLEAVNLLGKSISKRAGFKCEWCAGNHDLRLWEYQPDQDPTAENVALLCEECRNLYEAKSPDMHKLRAIRNALWSDIPAVSEGAAIVLSRCKEPWAREAIEESFIDENLKEKLL
jgi:hypothetical protein